MKTPFGTPIEIQPPAKKEAPKAGKPTFGQEVDPGQAPPKRPHEGRKWEPTFGQEVDSGKAPPKREAPKSPFAPKPLQPIDIAPPGSGTMVFKAVNVGLLQTESPPNLPPGATPSAQNVLAREGTLEPRFRLAKVGSGSSICDDVLSMGEYVSVTGARAPYAISALTFSCYTQSAWTAGAYVANSVNDPPSGADTNYIDSVVVYDPTPDENVVVWVNGVDQAFSSSTGLKNFSTFTNAPIAKTVAVWNSRVMYGNITSGGTTYPQRIVYSEKFVPSITTTPTGGQDDLMDARGALVRLIGDGERVLALFEHEIWFGLEADYPFNVAYRALERNVGCSAPWSVCQTPRGVFFLGDDYMPYIIPRGSVPQKVGLNVWKTLRDEIDVPTRAHAEYNPETGEVLLMYPHQGGTGRPKKGLALNLDTGTWTPQTFDVAITRMTNGDYVASSVTWGGLVGSWLAQTQTWSQLGGTSNQRSLYAGTSTGTVAVFASTATGDFATAVETDYLVVMGNEDPTRKQYVREVRLDYRSASASSCTVRLSNDFGQTWQSSVGVALPIAPTSGQTTVWVGMEATYPTIQFQHDQGHRFAIQRCIALVAPTGRG